MEKQIQMKRILRYVLSFITLVTICTLAMVFAAMIPGESIQPQMEESAGYLTEHRYHFPYYLIDGVNSSAVDEVADANLLNIAYFLDPEHPLESVMRCDCYFDIHNQNGFFREAVNNDVKPNMQYYRYWHGSLIFVRPLLRIWNIRQIYVFHCFVLSGLILFLLIFLFKHSLTAEGISLIISMIAVSLWVVPLCLEFTWMFLLAFVVSIVSVKLAKEEKYDLFGILFFVTGMITIYLDFFTTETLTILIPLLLTLRIRKRQGKEGDGWFAVKCCILWGIGYVSMWAAKWCLASAVLNTDVTAAIQSSIEQHTGSAGYSTQTMYLLSVFLKNIYCLVPISYGLTGAVITFVIVFFFGFLPVCTNRVRLKETIRWQTILLYAFMGMIPYIRYAVIPHHSWYHYFFTYRAQAASVLALCFITLELVELNPRKAVTKNA